MKRIKREREREIKREREGKEPQPKEKKDTGISSLIRFDTATFSILTLLINKSYRKKLKKAKLKRFELRNQKIQTIFCHESSFN